MPIPSGRIQHRVPPGARPSPPPEPHPMNPVDFILHVDTHLLELVQQYGTWVYAILFLIIFAETGLVVTPFLPGDSLLFAIGALAAIGLLDPLLSSALIISAAFLGDNTNYWAGRLIGPKVFAREDSLFFRRSYLEKTEQFYNRYGSATVIIARFVPIVRTFAPFVAGIGRMPYGRFIGFSALGSLLWVAICLGGGYLFGNLPIVRDNFTLVVLGIIAVSILPAIIGVLRARRAAA
jgi:membrane-associated protein